MSDAAEAKTQEFEERGIPSEAEASIAPPKVEEGATPSAPAEGAADAAGGVDEAFFSAGFEIFLGRRPGSVKADQLGGQTRAFILRLLKSAEFQTRVLTVLAENGELPHDRWGGVRPNHVEWAQKVVKDEAALKRLSAEGVTWTEFLVTLLATEEVASCADAVAENAEEGFLPAMRIVKGGAERTFSGTAADTSGFSEGSLAFERATEDDILFIWEALEAGAPQPLLAKLLAGRPIHDVLWALVADAGWRAKILARLGQFALHGQADQAGGVEEADGADEVDEASGQEAGTEPLAADFVADVLSFFIGGEIDRLAEIFRAHPVSLLAILLKHQDSILRRAIMHAGGGEAAGFIKAAEELIAGIAPQYMPIANFRLLEPLRSDELEPVAALFAGGPAALEQEWERLLEVPALEAIWALQDTAGHLERLFDVLADQQQEANPQALDILLDLGVIGDKTRALFDARGARASLFDIYADTAFRRQLIEPLPQRDWRVVLDLHDLLQQRSQGREVKATVSGLRLEDTHLAGVLSADLPLDSLALQIGTDLEPDNQFIVPVKIQAEGAGGVEFSTDLSPTVFALARHGLIVAPILLNGSEVQPVGRDSFVRILKTAGHLSVAEAFNNETRALNSFLDRGSPADIADRAKDILSRYAPTEELLLIQAQADLAISGPLAVMELVSEDAERRVPGSAKGLAAMRAHLLVILGQRTQALATIADALGSPGQRTIGNLALFIALTLVVPEAEHSPAVRAVIEDFAEGQFVPAATAEAALALAPAIRHTFRHNGGPPNVQGIVAALRQVSPASREIFVEEALLLLHEAKSLQVVLRALDGSGVLPVDRIARYFRQNKKFAFIAEAFSVFAPESFKEPSVLLRLARWCRRARKLDLAESFNLALVDQPAPSVEACELWFLLAMDRNDAELAETRLEFALKQHPNEPRLLERQLRLMRAKAKKKAVDPALDKKMAGLTAAVKLRRRAELLAAPEDLSVRRAFARHLAENGEVADAIEIIEDMIAGEPENVELRLELMKVFQDEEDFERAGQVAQIVLDLEPSDRAAVVLARMYREREEFEKSAEVLSRFAHLDSVNLARELIRVELMQANFDRAAALSESMVLRYPTDVRLRIMAAAALLEAGRHYDAAYHAYFLMQHSTEAEFETAITLLVYAVTRKMGMFELAFSELDKLYERLGVQSVTLLPGTESEFDRLAGSGLYPAGALAALPVAGPRVSVVMTTYNSMRYIQTAVRSILEQSYLNIELIIVDDASDDGTQEFLLDLERSDERVRVILKAENQGTYPSKNTGIMQATGDYIALQDSDDWSHPDRIAKCVDHLERHPELIGLTTDWLRMTDGAEIVVKSGGQIAHDCCISLVFRRVPVLTTVGFFDSVRVQADRELIQRIKLIHGESAVADLEWLLLMGRSRSDSLTASEEFGLTRTGVSPVRRAYIEAYEEWHRDIVSGKRTAVLPFPLSRRPFEAPGPILPVRPSQPESVS